MTNTNALAQPASRRCTISIPASVTKPLSAMNRAANAIPIRRTAPGGQRRSNRGISNAPSKYPAALAVFMAPARV